MWSCPAVRHGVLHYKEAANSERNFLSQRLVNQNIFFFRSLTDSLGSNKPKKEMMVSLISSRISPLAVFVYCVFLSSELWVEID